MCEEGAATDTRPHWQMLEVQKRYFTTSLIAICHAIFLRAAWRNIVDGRLAD